MKKHLIWMAAFTFSLFLGQSAFAKDDWQCGDRFQNLVSELNLDQAQKDKMKPIVEEFKKKIKDSAEQMKGLRTQISEQMTSDKMDESTVNGLIDKKAQLIGDMMKAKVSAMNQINSILKPEQKAKLNEKMKKVEAKMSEKWEKCKDSSNE